MSDNKNQPAFPNLKKWMGNDTYEEVSEGGLTKREYMAIQIMKGMVSNPEIMEAVTASELIEGNAATRLSKLSVSYADTLLNELDKPVNQ